MKNSFLLVTFLSSVFAINFSANAENLAKNTAHMQAMDKITGRVSLIDVPVNGKVDFGSFSIVVRSCQTRSAEEVPDNFAFVDITDTDLSGKKVNVFRGWMISSSPATNAVEHPIYDVWLLQCLDKKIDKSLLLSEEELEKINSLPVAGNSDKNKSVADSIDEMQYQSEQVNNKQTSETSSEDMLIEFDMDEDSTEAEVEAEDENEEEEKNNDENTENQTEN